MSPGPSACGVSLCSSTVACLNCMRPLSSTTAHFLRRVAWMRKAAVEMESLKAPWADRILPLPWNEPGSWQQLLWTLF